MTSHVEPLAACGHPQDWTGLYRKDYDLATPESNAHPAKGSWDLAFRILDHLWELGLLKDGDTVCDPMCGTARFPIAACSRGLRAIGVELEPRFVAFSEQNRDYASRKLGRPLDLTIIQGDARRLSELLKERGLITVTSPPYLAPSKGGGIAQEGYTSPYQKGKIGGGNLDPVGQRTYMLENVGSTPGQIGALPDRPLKSITSPPYAGDNAKKAGGIDWVKANRPDRLELSAERHNVDGAVPGGYGEAPGNIGNLPDRPLVSITSPPYEDSNVSREDTWREGESFGGPHSQVRAKPYGQAKGQIGQERNEDYLSAMKLVYEQIALISDVLVVVTKNPTREGKLRLLDEDTCRLLEATGWRIHCRHRAILFEEHETQNLFGETKKRVKGRMSFFKRLQWQKGKSEIAQWEDVIFAVRDGGRGGLRTVMSPPYQDSITAEGQLSNEFWAKAQAEGKRWGKHKPATGTSYGQTPGQIGNLKDA